MGPVQPIQRWLRTSDRQVPQRVRALRRAQARLAARRRNGSISAYMEAIVLEANEAADRQRTAG